MTSGEDPDVGLFHQDDPPADPLKGGADGVFEVVDADGVARRYSPDDFDEIFATSDESEMHRHLSIGWLLLDEGVATDPGTRPSWLDTLFRREAGRVLPAGDDPAYVPPSDVPRYILGYLKAGRSGTLVG